MELFSSSVDKMETVAFMPSELQKVLLNHLGSQFTHSQMPDTHEEFLTMTTTTCPGTREGNSRSALSSSQRCDTTLEKLFMIVASVWITEDF